MEETKRQGLRCFEKASGRSFFVRDLTSCFFIVCLSLAFVLFGPGFVWALVFINIVGSSLIKGFMPAFNFQNIMPEGVDSPRLELYKLEKFFWDLRFKRNS